MNETRKCEQCGTDFEVVVHQVKYCGKCLDGKFVQALDGLSYRKPCLLCWIVGHKWQNTSEVDELVPGTTWKRITTTRTERQNCRRCGEPNPEYKEI